MNPTTAQFLQQVDQATAAIRDGFSKLSMDDLNALHQDLRDDLLAANIERNNVAIVHTGLALIGYYALIANMVEAREANK